MVDETDDLARRQFLRVAGGAGVTAAIGGVATASGSGDGEETCDGAVVTDSAGGELSSGESATHAFSSSLDSTCEIVFTLGGEADFDLYLTLDGREPTRNDYDRKSTSDRSTEVVTLDGETARTSSEFGVLVYAYGGGGRYAVEVEETSSEGGDNEGPTARISVSTTSVEEGQQVTFDASASTDPDDSIDRISWTLPPSGLFGLHPTYKTGEVVTHAFSSGGSYEVTLRVTDARGATDTETVTIDVEDNWWPVW